MENSINPRLTLFQSMIGQDMRQSISPFGRWLNGRLQEAVYGRLVADYEVRTDMVNPASMLHGGAASAMLDDLIGATVFTLNREYAFTSLNLSVDFLHAAPLDSIVTVTAQIVREGRNIIHAEGRIMAHDGKIIARCTTNLIQTSVRLPF